MAEASDTGGENHSGGSSEILAVSLPKLNLVPQSSSIAVENEINSDTIGATTESLEVESANVLMIPQNSKLLNLPGEILNNIYSHCKEEEPPMKDEILDQIRYHRQKGGQYFALFHVCRQLRVEFKPIWMAETTIKMILTESGRYWRTFFPATDDPTEAMKWQANLVLVPGAPRIYEDSFEIYDEIFEEDIAFIFQIAVQSPDVKFRFQSHQDRYGWSYSPSRQLNSIFHLIAIDSTFADMVLALYSCVLHIGEHVFLDFVFEGQKGEAWVGAIEEWFNQSGTRLEEIDRMGVHKRGSNWDGGDYGRRHWETLTEVYSRSALV